MVGRKWNIEKFKRSDFDEVRLKEERSDELITPVISAKITLARTSVKDAHPPQPTL